VVVALLGSSFLSFEAASTASAAAKPKPLVAELTIYSDGSAIGDGLAGWTKGHAFIGVKNISTSNITVGSLSNIAPQKMVTVGTWGNKDEHLGVWYNLEAYLIHGNPGIWATTSFTLGITAAELKTLNAYIVTHDTYGKTEGDALTNNCSTFAAGAWNSVAPLQFKVFAGLPFQSPAALALSIATFPGAQYATSVNIPWDPKGVWYAKGKKAPIPSKVYTAASPTILISPKNAATGTTVDVSGSCPAGSTAVLPSVTPDTGVDATYPLYPDSTFEFFLYLSRGRDQVTDIDPSTGLKVWPATNFAITAKCQNAAGVTTASYSGPYTASRGLAVRPSVVQNANSYTITIAPTSPCPSNLSPDLVGARIAAYPIGNPSQAITVGEGQGYSLDPSGTWTPFSYEVPKFAGGTSVDISTVCLNSDELVTFQFTPISMTVPTGP
jgi:hypothetical protein